jgi:hypothetical protein
LAGRVGESSFVATEGELQAGAHGVAAPVQGVSGVAASVGVVALGEFDAARIGARVVRAAAAVAERLRHG